MPVSDRSVVEGDSNTTWGVGFFLLLIHCGSVGCSLTSTATTPSLTATTQENLVPKTNAPAHPQPSWYAMMTDAIEWPSPERKRSMSSSWLLDFGYDLNSKQATKTCWRCFSMVSALSPWPFHLGAYL